MFSDSLLALTSISQWTLFIGIGLLIFGLVEKRPRFVLGGQVAFLLLGFAATYLVLTGSLAIPETDPTTITKEVKVLAYLKACMLFAAFVVFSLFLKFLKFKHQSYSVYLSLLFALMLFFWIFNIQQSAI